MAIQFVPYMTAVVAVHALLLSLRGLMAVNSLRALSQLYQEKWEGTPGEEKALVFLRQLRGAGVDIRKVKSDLPKLMKANLVVGFFGILYSLFAIAFLSESPQAGLLIMLSLIAVVSQLVIFSLTALNAMDILALWPRKIA